MTGVIAKYEAATARNRQARQSAAGGEHGEEAKILCRIDLCALKARRDLDADAALVRLTRHKNIREEAGESLQTMDVGKAAACGKRIRAMTCIRGKQILYAACDGRQNFIHHRPLVSR